MLSPQNPSITCVDGMKGDYGANIHKIFKLTNKFQNIF